MGLDHLSSDLAEETETMRAREDTRRSLLAKAGLVAGGVGLGTLARPGTALAHEGSLTVYNVRDHGADPTGITDSTTAINNTVAEATNGGIVYFPPGSYKITNTITIAKPVYVQGAGFAGNIFDGNVWNAATRIWWGGATNGTMLTVGPQAGLSGGFGLDGFALDGNGSALIGVNFNRARYGKIGSIGVQRLAGGGIAYDMNSDGATVSADNCMFLTCEHLLARAPTILRTRGSEPAVPANTCHIWISRIDGQCGSTTGNEPGVIHSECDNLTIGHAYISQMGTGRAVRFGARARSVLYLHLQAGNGVECLTPDDSAYSNRIVHYDRENGEPAPTINGGARLSWQETGRLSKGIFDNAGSSGAVTANRTMKISDATSAEVGVVQSATSVRGALAAFSTAVWVGTFTDHPVLFVKNAGEVFRLNTAGNLQINDARNIQLGTTTGSMIGTASGQKLAFFGVTPKVQPPALSAANGTPLPTSWNSTARSIVDNMRTRINQLESRLNGNTSTGLGLIGGTT